MSLLSSAMRIRGRVPFPVGGQGNGQQLVMLIYHLVVGTPGIRKPPKSLLNKGLRADGRRDQATGTAELVGGEMILPERNSDNEGAAASQRTLNVHGARGNPDQFMHQSQADAGQLPS